MDDILYRFEELPIWCDAGWTAGTISGWAEIDIHPADDWLISAIAIEADNGKTGDEAQSKRVWLGPSNPLLPILTLSLIANHRGSIEDAILARNEEAA